MKILVVGGTGMLGHKLIQVFKKEFDVYTTIRSDFASFKKYDLLEREKVFDKIEVDKFESFEKIIEDIKPDFVINAVGLIKQLPSSEDAVLTFNINSIFPQRMARIAAKYGFRLINISTDCVFSGKTGNYTETDISDAKDIYGKSKFLGEVFAESCLTIRTSIIGRELSTEHSLLEWFLSNNGNTVKGYKNAIYTGFPTIILAEILAGIINNQPAMDGLYHLSSEPINKFELLNLIKEKYNLNIEIEPFEDFYIDRSLDCTKFRNLTGFQPPSWEEMISRMASDPTPYEKWRNC